MGSKRIPKVLLVDDEPDNLFLLELYLKKLDVEIFLETDSRKVKQLFEEINFDLAIFDICMPHLDGIELCKWVKSDIRFQDCCIVFSTALDAEDNIDVALEAGGIDYLIKPVKGYEIIARVKSALRLKNSIDEIHKSRANQHATLLSLKHKNIEVNNTLIKLQDALTEIEEIQSTVLFSLSKLAESRDNETGKHLTRTQHYCKLICEALREREEYKDYITNNYIKSIMESAPLHDIGKVGIPDSILRKQGKLSDEEFDIMKSHTSIGANTLRDAARQSGKYSFLKMAICISHYHHEKNDGSGYPSGLKGEDIPLSARIMSLADVYDALRCRRCYKEPISHEETCRIIIEVNGESYFHKDVLEAFKDKEDQFKKLSIELAD